MSMGGSPPRVRVLRSRKVLWYKNDRITPACAGITGEMYNRFSNIIGSPPRVRVLQLRQPEGLDVSRITPACAGITLKFCVFLELSSKVFLGIHLLLSKAPGSLLRLLKLYVLLFCLFHILLMQFLVYNFS